jgi:Golgi apparatus protein 1
MKLMACSSLLVAASLIGLSVAQAEEQENQHACRADVQKFCKGVRPGGGRIVICLKQHESELSSGCRERIAEAKEEGKELAAACKPDAEKLCKGVQPGQGRVASCLKQHQDQLSGECREKIAEAQSRHPCMKDAERLCKGVQPGEGRVMQCLHEHEAELSAECKAHGGQEGGGGKK